MEHGSGGWCRGEEHQRHRPQPPLHLRRQVPKHQGELGRKVKPCEGWTAVLYFSTSFSDKPEAPGDTPYPYLLTDEQAKEIALHADPLSLAALDDLASFQILPALKRP